MARLSDKAHLQLLSETAEPSQWRFEVVLGQLVRAFTLVGIEQRERLAAPSDQDLYIHIPCFGPLVGRGKKGQGGLLDTVFRLRGFVRQRVPAGVLLPGTLQYGGCFMFDVID